MAQAFIAVGSNIEPEENIPRAIDLLARQVHLCALSTFYRTPPLAAPQPHYGTASQPDFYNGIVSVETSRPPLDLKWQVLRPIEASLGRRRTSDKFAPRPIDLDLLLFGDLIYNTPDLVLPDPEIPHRPFLAIPLLELAPTLILPDTRLALSQLAQKISTATLHPLSAFSAHLRAQFKL
jgi:dihydroneopterin aldolase/2-amino-4-hydroxy-6-hydroxymethyldihydropteridine diphosphokinase